MPDDVQPGVRIGEDVWEQFREEVADRRGGVRGHLRTELENALRAYIRGGDATPAEINTRLQRIEAAVGAAGTDGGTDTRDGPRHTHTPEPAATEKPSPNAPTEKKVAYLAECLRDGGGLGTIDDGTELPRAVIRNVVKEEYGFRRDTAKRYVEELIDHFGLRESPAVGVDNLVSEERYGAILDEQRSDTAEELENP